MIYYGLIFYISRILCPIRCLLIISIYLVTLPAIFYSLKRFKFIFLTREVFFVDLIGSNLIIITWILTFGCLIASFLSLSYSTLFILTIFIASCRIRVYISFVILEFYINFELSLFPILFIILGWGYQPERFSAGFALLLYTIAGSLPLLLALTFLNSYHIFTFTQLLNNWNLSLNSRFLSIITTLAFLTKLPIFLFHSWLPKAHVEAPVFGSIFLAGTLLKLGALGLYRVSSLFNFIWLRILIILSIVAIALIRFLCLISRDIKILIAYSSVIHIGLALIIVLFLTQISLNRGIIIFITHGLSSSLIFLIAYIIYIHSNSRRLLSNQNITLFSPLITLFWFIRCVGIIGGPPTSTLLRELIRFRSLVSNWSPSSFLLISRAFLGGAFRIILYSRTSHNLRNLIHVNYNPYKFNETRTVQFHIFWLIRYFFIFIWTIYII